jgi:UDP-glucose 4-epimerase
MGHTVTAADDLSTGYRSSRDSSVELAKGKLEQSKFLVRVFEKSRPDLYIHAAGQRDIVRSWEDPVGDLEKTAHGFLGVLEACQTVSLSRIMLLSTGEVLTPSKDEDSLSEETQIRPVSPYGGSHALCEFYLDSFSRRLNIKPAIVRLSPVYGPGQTTYGEGGLVGSAIRQTLLKSANNPPTIPGNGGRVRDFIYIDDAIEGLLQIILQDKTGIYHLGSGIPRSDRHIFLVIAELLDCSFPVNYHALPYPDVPMRLLGSKRLQEETDWKPEVDFRDGIGETVEFFRKGIQ